MPLPDSLPLGSPNADTRETPAANGEPICRCGATTLSAKSDERCANGHLLRGNRAASIVGHHGANFRREHEGEINAMADRFARDVGYVSLASAPLAFQVVSVALARTVKVADLAYWRMLEAGGPLSESGKPRRAYTVWNATNTDLARDLKGVMAELSRQPINDRQPQFADHSTDELIAKFLETVEALDSIEAMRDGTQFTHRASAGQPDLPSSATCVAPDRLFTVDTASRPATSTAPAARSAMIDSGPNPPSGPETRASSEPRAARPPAVAAPPVPRTEEPRLTVYGREITEQDVRRVMADEGSLAAYELGQISRADAYRRAAAFIRQLAEMPGGRR